KAKETSKKKRAMRAILLSDENGNWLTRAQMKKKHGASKLDPWTIRESKIRVGEKALRTTKVVRDFDCISHARIDVFCEKDWIAIQLGDEGPSGGEIKSRRLRARNWLQAFLSDGPKRASDVIVKRRRDSVGEYVLRHAKRQLGIVVQRLGVGPFW